MHVAARGTNNKNSCSDSIAIFAVVSETHKVVYSSLLYCPKSLSFLDLRLYNSVQIYIYIFAGIVAYKELQVERMLM